MCLPKDFSPTAFRNGTRFAGAKSYFPVWEGDETAGVVVKETAMKYTFAFLSAIVASVALLGESAWAVPTTPVLGSTEDYAVLGASTVTNTGSTTITGDVGLYPGPSITGFEIPPANTLVQGPTSTGLVNGPGLVTGTIHIADITGTDNAKQAQVDLTKAYTALALLAPTGGNLSGSVLGSGGTIPTLNPGVYSFSSTAQLTGALTLNAQGKNGVFWVFQIGTDLTTASASSVTLVDPGSNNGSDDGVFWVLGTSDTAGLGSATLGTTTAFEGNILALTSITLNTGASIENGRALAEVGAVTLDDNVISNVCPPPNGGPGFSGGVGFNASGELVNISGEALPVIPEPCTLLLVGSGLVGLVTSRVRRARRSLR